MKKYVRKTKRGSRRLTLRTMSLVVSISLYPEQWDHVRQRARELNLSQSEVIQVLVDVDKRDGTCRQELLKRLGVTAPEVVAA